MLAQSGYVLEPSYRSMLANANAADGVLLADEDGRVDARIFASADTAANVNASVPDAGEVVYISDLEALVLGNGTSSGGRGLGLNGQNCIFVAGTGTAAQNGTALSDAITAAALRTPYGAALSATNPIWIALGPGVFDITGLASFLTLPNFVYLKGVLGSEATSITTTTSRYLKVLQASGTAHYCNLHGITFNSTTPGFSILIQFAASTAQFIYINWFDINLPGLSTAQSCMSLGSMTGTTTPTFQGVVRRVRTTGARLFGGHATALLSGNLTLNVRFEDCEGGDYSFGSGVGGIDVHNGIVEGTLAGFYRCRQFGTGTAAFSVVVNCPMVDCDWQPAIQRLGSSAYIVNSRIGEAVSTYSINHSSAVNARLSGNRMAGGIGPNVTNTIAGGSLDAAGNFVDAQV